MALHDDKRCPTCGLSIADFQELKREIEELKQEIVELKRRLSVYENSNTPPSRNSLLYREMKKKRREERQNRNSPGNKPGRKTGHDGVTQTFIPSGRPIIHSMDRCPRCNSKRLSIISTEKRTLVDIPEPLPYTVEEHIFNIYKCSGCGAEDLLPESVTTRGELPRSSVTVTNQFNSIVVLGKNVLSIVSLLWSVARLPRRKISYVFESLYHLKLSPATIGHSLENVSERLKAFHEKVRRKINRSKAVNYDETGMPVDGKKGWIWLAATKKYAFVQVAMSRGSDVLEKYFSNFKGVAIVDGWKSYRYFKTIQRDAGLILLGRLSYSS